MNNGIKFYLALFICVSFTLSCSLFNKLKEELAKEETESGGVKEETAEDSYLDLEFYNKYIEVSNKLSESVDNVQKAYLQTVPEPKSIKKGSFIIIVMADTYLGFLERDLKEQQRSLNDGGELSKLTASDEMKRTIEADFNEWLKTIEAYIKTADKVISYYKDNDYKEDLSKAVPYDEEIQSKYRDYQDAYNKLTGDLKKYKPEREVRDPDDYSNPDEKSVVILENAYYNILDRSDDYMDEFKKSPDKPDLKALRIKHDELEKVFGEESAKVQSAPFTEKSKYLKYNYEDYFSKMVDGFLDSSADYMKKMEKGNLKDYEYNIIYDAVIRGYNNVITSYNSSINNLNSFVIY